MITAPKTPTIGRPSAPAPDTWQTQDNAASPAVDSFVRLSASSEVEGPQTPALFRSEAPQGSPGPVRRRDRYLRRALDRASLKRKTPAPLSPTQVNAFLASGDLQRARQGFQEWVRASCCVPGRTTHDRDSIIAAANAINLAFGERTEAGACAETALARRKTAVCITADALNTWDASLHVVEAEIIAVAPPFVRAFRPGDVVLGMAEAREKLLCMLPSTSRETAYADATNAAWMLAPERLSRLAANYLMTHRPDFVEAFLRAPTTGNDVLAANLWQWICTHPHLRSKVEERLRSFNATTGPRDDGETRELFYRLSRLLCKARVMYTLAAGGRVHFELGADFDYHAAASKTRPGSGRMVPEDSSGHFTSSELRTVCAALLHTPGQAAQILFYQDSFPVPPPPDLLAHYSARAKY